MLLEIIYLPNLLNHNLSKQLDRKFRCNHFYLLQQLNIITIVAEPHERVISGTLFFHFCSELMTFNNGVNQDNILALPFSICYDYLLFFLKCNVFSYIPNYQQDLHPNSFLYKVKDFLNSFMQMI